jgi:epoxyqueuosine reductase
MPALADLLRLDDQEFRQKFAGSPVRRTGHARFLRNLLVAAGNSSDITLLPLIEMRLRHNDPLVRGMAVWAFAQLVDAERYQIIRSEHALGETDNDVLAEWAEWAEG